MIYHYISYRYYLGREKKIHILKYWLNIRLEEIVFKEKEGKNREKMKEKGEKMKEKGEKMKEKGERKWKKKKEKREKEEKMREKVYFVATQTTTRWRKEFGLRIWYPSFLCWNNQLWTLTSNFLSEEKCLQHSIHLFSSSSLFLLSFVFNFMTHEGSKIQAGSGAKTSSSLSKGLCKWKRRGGWEKIGWRKNHERILFHFSLFFFTFFLSLFSKFNFIKKFIT